MNQDDRDARDAAGVGPYARQLDQLVAMSTLESWKVADGEPDIRGWEVQTVSNRQLGTVRDLMIDTAAGEVVLVDIDLPGTDKHTLVPIRVIQIDRARRVILMDSADVPELDAGIVEKPAGVSGRRTADIGTVRYPRTDREVLMQRSPIADGVIADEHRISPDDVSASASERRRAERRQIHRIATDI
jgi:hypothetical protein